MLPNMTDALGGLTQQIQFAVIEKKQEGFNTVERVAETGYFQACLQPLTPRQLAIKTEGERRWKWYTAWTTKDLAVDSYVRDHAGLQYRVMSKADWSQAGYFEYEFTQGSNVTGTPK